MAVKLVESRQRLSDWQAEYLKVLGLDDPPPVTVDGLKHLVEAQLSAIPFDGLDPLFRAIPEITPEGIQEKILRQGRGGYCFELNGLLRDALQAFGFSVDAHLARVIWRVGHPLPRTHILLSVTIDGVEWLADVGFGAPGPTTILRRDLSTPVYDRGVGYRVRKDPDLGTCIERAAPDETWSPLYAFTEEPLYEEDFEAANLLAATWDGVPFRHFLVTARLTPKGVIGLQDQTLVRRDLEGREHKETLPDAEALITCLTDEFNITLSDAMRAKIRSRYQNP